MGYGMDEAWEEEEEIKYSINAQYAMHYFAIDPEEWDEMSNNERRNCIITSRTAHDSPYKHIKKKP